MPRTTTYANLHWEERRAGIRNPVFEGRTVGSEAATNILTFGSILWAKIHQMTIFDYASHHGTLQVFLPKPRQIAGLREILWGLYRQSWMSSAVSANREAAGGSHQSQ